MKDITPDHRLLIELGSEIYRTPDIEHRLEKLPIEELTPLAIAKNTPTINARSKLPAIKPIMPSLHPTNSLINYFRKALEKPFHRDCENETYPDQK